MQYNFGFQQECEILIITGRTSASARFPNFNPLWCDPGCYIFYDRQMLRVDEHTGFTAQMNSFCSLKGISALVTRRDRPKVWICCLLHKPVVSAGSGWTRPRVTGEVGSCRVSSCVFFLFLCLYICVCVVSNRADLCPRSTAGGRRRTLCLWFLHWKHQ